VDPILPVPDGVPPPFAVAALLATLNVASHVTALQPEKTNEPPATVHVTVATPLYPAAHETVPSPVTDVAAAMTTEYDAEMPVPLTHTVSHPLKLKDPPAIHDALAAVLDDVGT
jgi:hypothetical protein